MRIGFLPCSIGRLFKSIDRGRVLLRVVKDKHSNRSDVNIQKSGEYNAWQDACFSTTRKSLGAACLPKYAGAWTTELPCTHLSGLPEILVLLLRVGHNVFRQILAGSPPGSVV